uniref:BCL6B transcription repressor n=1 Tax=Amphilophus citrinellus TaxID=61819 RepID=A0A3Q0SMG7_AMPCI
MEVLEGYRVNRGQGMRAAAPAEGYVKEFTRHSNDVLLNLNELRHRSILTDTTLIVGNVHLQAHCAVLVACSGFFYSMYSRRALLQGRGGSGEQLMTVSLPTTLDPSSVSLLLDFMYTSRLPLTPSIVSGVLAVAVYLQMDHVADTCRDFITLVYVPLSLDRFKLKGEPESPLMGSPTLSPSSPARSSCQPSSPAASETCNKNLVSDAKATPDPKACNWKKYKYIVLNPLCAASAVKVEEMEEPQNRASPTVDLTPNTPTEAWSGEVKYSTLKTFFPWCYYKLTHSSHPEAAGHSQHPVKRENYYMSYCYSGNLQGNLKNKHATVTFAPAGDKPYRCNVCGAQFNRPANLKTHSRIHSGEKPYRCDTCGARFVQVAHLRAHVLIHTGEKPYPCNTCGTRFRHLQTLKSHLRIHTGEKPYTCEKCDLHFRHKSQLRLHLRQKHGAVTNTKIRYKVLTEPYQPILQAC